MNRIRRVTAQPSFAIAIRARKDRKHGVPLTEEEAEVALAELDEMKYDESFSSQEFTPELTPEDVHGEV